MASLWWILTSIRNGARTRPPPRLLLLWSHQAEGGEDFSSCHRAGPLTENSFWILSHMCIHNQIS